MPTKKAKERTQTENRDGLLSVAGELCLPALARLISSEYQISDGTSRVPEPTSLGLWNASFDFANLRVPPIPPGGSCLPEIHSPPQ
jgi:hypothetical protein